MLCISASVISSIVGMHVNKGFKILWFSISTSRVLSNHSICNTIRARISTLHTGRIYCVM